MKHFFATLKWNRNLLLNIHTTHNWNNATKLLHVKKFVLSVWYTNCEKNGIIFNKAIQFLVRHQQSRDQSTASVKLWTS